MFKDNNPFWLVAVIAAAFGVAVPNAAEAASFTDILATPSFTGNWNLVDKLGFFGEITSGCITIVSILGLCIIIISILASILYLSNRNIFNEIHEIKQVGVSGGDNGLNAFGIAPMWKEVGAGKRGSGLDAIVAWFMSIMIDVKKYSYYADGAKGMGEKLDADTDTIGQFVLSTFLGTVVAISILSMGFNGTLWQGYATVVDGIGVVGERLVNVNLENAVATALDSGANYDFAFESSNTELGHLQDKVAGSMYYQILGRSSDYDNNYKNAVGRNIEEWVATNVTIENINTYVKSTVSSVQAEQVNIATDEDLNGVRYDIIINTNETNLSGGQEVGVSVPMQTFIEETGSTSNYYMHIVFSKDRVSTGGFFTVPDEQAAQ